MSATPARRVAVLGGLAIALLALAVATIALGSVTIPAADVLAVLARAEPSTAAWTTIVWDVRLPRAATAVLAGAALGVSGLQMQTLFRNPLADPFVLGVSSGASLGVALVVLGGGLTSGTLVGGLPLLASVGVTVAAAIGAGVVTVGVLVLSRRVANPATILILGLMAGYVVSSAVTVLVHANLASGDRTRAYIAWGFGSFSGTSWQDLTVLVSAIAIAMGLAVHSAKALDALLLGEGYAATMGLDVRRARIQIAVSASLLAAAVTAFCGPIGFLGIAIPHLARGLLRTSSHRLLVPSCALTGAVVALAAGLISLQPGRETGLPLNAITALIGAPVVIAVLLRLRRGAQAVAA